MVNARKWSSKTFWQSPPSIQFRCPPEQHKIVSCDSHLGRSHAISIQLSFDSFTTIIQIMYHSDARFIKQTFFRTKIKLQKVENIRNFFFIFPTF